MARIFILGNLLAIHHCRHYGFQPLATCLFLINQVTTSVNKAAWKSGKYIKRQNVPATTLYLMRRQMRSLFANDFPENKKSERSLVSLSLAANLYSALGGHGHLR